MFHWESCLDVDPGLKIPRFMKTGVPFGRNPNRPVRVKHDFGFLLMYAGLVPQGWVNDVVVL